jgi:beta-glucanase (GH16 family)
MGIVDDVNALSAAIEMHRAAISSALVAQGQAGGDFPDFPGQIALIPLLPPVEPAAPTGPVGFTGAYTKLFEDTFSGSSLDLAKWQPNWFGATPTTITKAINSAETCAYDPAQVQVANGQCRFSTAGSPVTVDGTTYQFRSGMLSSNGKFSVAPLSGKPVVAEARIYTEASSGTTVANWPAFWLNGQSWPADGEIDIAEGLGGNVNGHFHYPGGDPGTASPAGDNTGWHVWSVRWTYQDKVEFARDGVVYATLAPRGSGYAKALRQPKYILLNLGMGQWGGPNKVPGEMMIDYVRVWRLT